MLRGGMWKKLDSNPGWKLLGLLRMPRPQLLRAIRRRLRERKRKIARTLWLPAPGIAPHLGGFTPVICRWCTGCCWRVPREEAEDLVQEVFMQALRKLSTLREPGAIGGWLATIARNRAHDYFRRSRSRVDLPDEIPAAKDTADTEALAALAAIRRLPEAYRETLVLRLVEGMSGPEIATRTGLTPGSVRVNLHRGMAQLREILGKE